MSPSSVPVTPEEIIDLLVEEMEAGSAPSRYSVLVRSVYHVFLHPDDYERLRLVFPDIEREAVRALSERLEFLNRKPVLAFLSNDNRKTWRRVGAGGWRVLFYENRDPEAEQNPLIVKSLFDEPHPMEERAGIATERTARRSASGQREAWVHAATTNSAGAPRTRPSLYGTFTFEDSHGPQRYEMTQPSVRIGRQSKEDSLRPDVVVAVEANVSKQHCEVRWDETKRQFFLRDSSKFGTSVNGKQVPPHSEVVLPHKAKIRLADTVTLVFRSELE